MMKCMKLMQLDFKARQNGCILTNMSPFKLWRSGEDKKIWFFYEFGFDELIYQNNSLVFLTIKKLEMWLWLSRWVKKFVICIEIKGCKNNCFDFRHDLQISIDRVVTWFRNPFPLLWISAVYWPCNYIPSTVNISNIATIEGRCSRQGQLKGRNKKIKRNRTKYIKLKDK